MTTPIKNHALVQPVPAPEGLRAAIFLSITRAQRRQALLRIALWGTALAGSTVVAVVAGIAVYTSLAGSGFAQLASLAFSDTAIVFSHWQDFAFSLAESLPVLALTGVLAGVLLFLASLRQMIPAGSWLGRHAHSAH